MRLIDADALKEAITETDSWLMYNEWGSKTLFHEFIDNAPTIEPSGDLISRQEAIDVVGKELQYQEENRIPYDSHDNGTCYGLKKARELLLALPSADRPQVNSAEWVAQKEKEFDELNRQKGEWLIIDFDLTPFNYEGFYCSNCRHIYDYKMNFCPNCGADMRGEKDEVIESI